MGKRKPQIHQSDIVKHFAARLRELRNSHGLTQSELARHAQVTSTYIGRLESGSVAPGIDLVDRLAKALGTSPSDLLPAAPSSDTLELLRNQAQSNFASLLAKSDLNTLRMLNPLLARLIESASRSR